MIIRVVQGKGRKDRQVKLPNDLPGLLKAWWTVRSKRLDAGTPLSERWLFPGGKDEGPTTPRQLSRLFRPRDRAHGRDHQAGDLAFAPPQFRHPSAGERCRYPCDSGHARTQQIGCDRALHTSRHRHDCQGRKPARSFIQAKRPCQNEEEETRAGLARRNGVPSKAGGRGYFPRPRRRLAGCQCRPSEPWPAQGDERHRALSDRSARGPCQSLRELRSSGDRLQQLS